MRQLLGARRKGAESTSGSILSGTFGAARHRVCKIRAKTILQRMKMAIPNYEAVRTLGIFWRYMINERI